MKLAYETIERRLGDLKARGVALKEGFTLRDLYEERTPLYEKYADVIVELDDRPIVESVNKVAEALRK